MSELLPHRVKYVDWKYSKALWWKIPIIWRWIEWAKVPTVYLNSKTTSMFVHEYTHVEQMYRYGAYLWSLGYVLWPGFRVRQEGEAYAVQIKEKLKTGRYRLQDLIEHFGKTIKRVYVLPPWWTAEKCSKVIESYYNKLET